MMPIKKRHLLIALLFFPYHLVLAGSVPDQPNPGISMNDTIINSLILPGAALVLISDQFSFTEGPAADRHGNVFFTDQPNDKIWKYDTDGKLSLFMDKTGRSNGLYFDTSGNILACADEQNELWKITPQKKVTVLLKDYNGQPFNGPNDVWVNPVTGGIYFTDPFYKRDYWNEVHTKREELVYYLNPKNGNVIKAATQLQKPNGIIGTPDGRTLYIADIGDNKTYKYVINTDGSLGPRQLFTNQGSDGMTIDSEGNIYLTGKGVTVYGPDGKLLQHIPVPENWTANVCFGGQENNTLFITASKSVYRLEMRVKGDGVVGK